MLKDVKTQPFRYFILFFILFKFKALTAYFENEYAERDECWAKSCCNVGPTIPWTGSLINSQYDQ